MKYCEKCLAKKGNFDFFVITLQTSCGAFIQREREREGDVTNIGAGRVNDVCSELMPSYNSAEISLCYYGSFFFFFFFFVNPFTPT